MATTVTNGTDYITITRGSGRVRKINKGYISSINPYPLKNEVHLFISGDGFYEPGKVILTWTETTTPSTANFDDFVTAIEGYCHETSIAEGQVELTTGANTITFDAPLPTASYTLLINDVDGVGVGVPTSLTKNGFAITAVAPGTLTYIAIA